MRTRLNGHKSRRRATALNNDQADFPCGGATRLTRIITISPYEISPTVIKIAGQKVNMARNATKNPNPPEAERAIPIIIKTIGREIARMLM
jgi:hypothetical protein